MAKKKKRRRRKLKPQFYVLLFILIIGGLAAAGAVYIFGMTHMYLQVESGTVLTPESFKARDVQDIHFTNGEKEIVTKTPGTYWIDVYADRFNRKCCYSVADTVAPQGEAVDVVIMPGQSLLATDFVTNIVDKTDVTCEFATDIDMKAYGKSEVRVFLTDEGGNQSVVVANLTVSKVDIENGYELEAGSQPPKPEYFLLDEGKIEYTGSATSFVEFNKVGTYPVYLKVDDENVTVNVNIVDTVAPVLECTDGEGYIDYPLNPEKLVVSCEDETGITYSYEGDVDWSKEGDMAVTVVATDEGGNEAKQTVNVTLAADTQAPVIMGAGLLSVVKGGSISYREGVTVYDNCDDDIELQIDNSQVDLNVCGTYPVVYTATDHAGNSTELTFNLTVMEELPEEVTMEEMYEKVDEILAEIITDDMSLYEKAEAIYNWTRYKIYFVDHTQKENWVESAYDGIMTRHGDCFTYASVAKAMLTRVGIPNIDVERNSVLSCHFWNLIDIGEGWYHFDATPRADKTIIFYWSESQLCGNEPVRRSHVYNRDLYPKVNQN